MSYHVFSDETLTAQSLIFNIRHISISNVDDQNNHSVQHVIGVEQRV